MKFVTEPFLQPKINKLLIVFIQKAAEIELNRVLQNEAEDRKGFRHKFFNKFLQNHCFQSIIPLPKN